MYHDYFLKNSLVYTFILKSNLRLFKHLDVIVSVHTGPRPIYTAANEMCIGLLDISDTKQKIT